MTDAILKKALQESVNEVLEKMFFAQTMGESQADCVGSAAPEIAARLTFAGEPPGVFSLRLTRDAARQIAADFLGADEEEVGDERLGQVICELTNMVCGSVLSRVESSATFRLSAPCIVPAGFGDDSISTHYVADLANGRLAVNIAIGSPQ